MKGSVSMALVSKIDNNSSMPIPDEILKKAGLKPGTEVIWLYNEDSKQITIMEKPQNFAKALRGLGKEIWKGTDTDNYVQGERAS